MEKETKILSERVLIEERLAQISRFYGFISRINHAIIRISDRGVLLKQICAAAIDIGGFKMAWIGTLNKDRGIIEPEIFSGFESGYLSNIKIVLDQNIAEGRGPTAIAFRGGEPFACNDIAEDEAMAPWREEALKRGYRSSIALPIKCNGIIAGAWSIYSSEPNFFNNEEIGLLDDAAGNLSFALEAIEMQRQRNDAISALRESEERMRIIAENISEVFWLANAEKSRILYISPAYKTIWGRDTESLLSSPLNWLEAIHPDDRERARKAADWRKSSSGYNEEYRIIRPDGEIKWIRDKSSAIYDENGKAQYIVGIASDITDVKMTVRRNELQVTVTELLSGATDFNKSLHEALAIICSNLGFDWAEIWTISESKEHLKWLLAWHHPTKNLNILERRSKGLEYSRSDGLPGCVWASKRPVWISDIYKDLGSFKRAEAASGTGLRSALGVPIFADGDVVGTAIFLSNESAIADEETLPLVGALSNQIGQFIYRRRALEDLQKSEDRFQALFQTAIESVRIISAPGVLIDINPAGLAMLQADSLSEAMSKPLTGWVAPEYKKAFTALFKNVVKYGIAETLQFEALGNKGARRKVETYAAPLRGKDGNIVALIEITRDISQSAQEMDAKRRN